ncbi:MAG TPA: SGNH/GDSL hydrolase family protein [Pyrinomonadaceae bacterium]|jgi:lysophospholipase L1-like esterase
MREASALATVGRRRPSRLRSAALNLLLLLAGSLLALLLLEGLLRLYNPFQARIKGNRIILETNKTYHIKNDIIKSLDREVTVVRNALGFRGANPPADFSERLTIVTIGGSTTQCFFLNEDQTWTAQLGQRLEKSFSHVWVNNAGLDGHSTHGHLVLLEDYVVALRPKVALFLVGANDIASASLSEWDSENIKSGIRFDSGKAFVKSLSAYSEVTALVLNMYRSLTAYRAGLTHHQVDLRMQGYLDVSEEAEREYIERYSGQYLKDYEARLGRLADICRSAGIEPVFVTQPLLAGFGTDDLTGVDLARVKADGAQQTGKMYWNLLEVYNDSTRHVGREKGILVIDLARKLPKTSRYFYDFIHYTPQGAQAIAGILYQSLCPMLQTKYPQYTVKACAP